jgi:hypothetical protein
MYDLWWLNSISETVYVFMYFDIFYFQWRNLAKKDLWNEVYMYMNRVLCGSQSQSELYDIGF